MKVIETPIRGLLRIRPDVHGDERGFFLESFHAKKFAALGIPHLFVQDNHSRSARGVLRGLHFQKRHPQGKLVRVLSGSLFDVAVDLRHGSPTFGHWFGLTLSAGDPEFLYLPEGMAHGFLALEDRTELFYKCTDFYDPADEGGLRWNDPAIGIAWPETPAVLSPKDAAFPVLAKILPEDLPRV
ncbi:MULTISPECIES: dTDP-4-dehydrorhamnose 3,5-epimerase [Leptospirillum]|uniref:dTDP-4-dehydrorhamnose 3,5-epimerase n=3 Tax=Leptospirillum ferriphilum TaxID=178606 RepID=A0A059XTH7_9BACT|nr:MULTISPECIES: dTDP-4-dehydrorhamnose 3,5-epimerase [Leptospirillum]EAY57499.1 MAG: DTDP-4-dehydrorhamnose 3,5-epimerase [Leptospirillum rubarum]EIJ75814.1 MAG: DTDP-4-dehydrorhamnose 3,5-epimerase [Leptospirillum sp. Group II 'C75']AFS52960.1 dTDP-4-dehydrorhamnose 3,5-epimerase(rfbC) [Leptospirillum ferriphilum ML-04]AIA30128.1 dTDP-4-dehydrorhamnose 3,5-epimerase [Leptospirillum ferriphilum YSK]AKS22999.1 dTDP-4-dehydrorhamnose 3,5-epimerase [Leptospirillum sp. Group II 'CF-1']